MLITYHLAKAGRYVTRPATAQALWADLQAHIEDAADLILEAPDWEGIRYRREGVTSSGPRSGGRDDRWVLPPLPVIAGWRVGDCEDLSALLGGWLLQRGYDVRAVIQEFREGGRVTGFHALLAVPREGRTARPNMYLGPDLGWGPDGWFVLDPSWRVGMYHPDYGYHPEATAAQREPV